MSTEKIKQVFGIEGSSKKEAHLNVRPQTSRQASNLLCSKDDLELVLQLFKLFLFLLVFCLFVFCAGIKGM